MTPWFSENILHYKTSEREKTFDCSNENVKEYLKTHDDKLPQEVVDALMKTGEYTWIRGDQFSNYFPEVYHRCWLTQKEPVEKIGNVSSNPGYGSFHIKGQQGWMDCPRCHVIWSLYEQSRKPLKFKFITGFLISKYQLSVPFYKAYVFFRETFYVLSKKGKTCLSGWCDEMKKEPQHLFFLCSWRKPWMRFLLKNTKAKAFKVQGRGYLLTIQPEEDMSAVIQKYVDQKFYDENITTIW